MILSGQGRNNIWTFGERTGLDFTTGTPQIISSQVYAFEGAASVCNSAGELLFYGVSVGPGATTGNVWNRLHQPMPNGTGILGNTRGSSRNGVVIVPVPNDTNLYYLFVIDEVEAGPPQSQYLRYSVIDMRLDNSLGDVLPGQKNIILDSFMWERMFSVQGAGCYDWLIVLANIPGRENEFHAFRIDQSGVQGPVISPAGPRQLDGDIRISPDTRTIVAHLADGPGVPPRPRPYTDIGLYKFDNRTGIVSDLLVWDSVMPSYDYHYYHEFEFSPDNTKLYMAGFVGGILQYDITALPDLNAVKATEYLVADTNRAEIMGYFRKGPDGKLYIPVWGVTGTGTHTAGYVRCISQPDVSGIGCGYLPTFIPMPGLWHGLGNHVIDRRLDTVYFRTDTALCFTPDATISAPADYDQYTWDDGSPGLSVTLTGPGVRWVRSVSPCIGLRVDTFYVSARPPDTTAAITDTAICFAPSLQLISSEAMGSCIWSNGDTGCVRTVTAADTLWVYNREDCRVTIDTFKISFIRFDTDLGNDTTICGSDSLMLDVSIPFAGVAYTWQDATTGPVHVVRTPGLYAVTVQVDHCIATDTLMVYPGDTLTRVRDTVVCFAPSATLMAAPGYERYLWHQGDTTPFLEVQEPQTAWVYATRNCSTVLDSFIVDFIRFAPDIGNDTVLCEGSLVLNAFTSGGIYLWHNGTTDPELTVSAPGLYAVSVTVGPCTAYDTISVRYEPVMVSAIADQHICHGRATILDASTPGATAYLWDDQSTDPVRVVREAGTYHVLISNSHCVAADTVQVTSEYCDCPVFIPDAFTPNGDGKNDFFGPTIGCPPSDYRLMIYNRYGQQVFISNDILIKWDGYYNGAQQGTATFYYHLQFTGKDGMKYSYKGDVTLVR